MGIVPRNIHTSDGQGFEDTLEDVVNTLRRLLLRENRQIATLMTSVGPDDRRQRAEDVAHIFRSAEHPYAPHTAVARFSQQRTGLPRVWLSPNLTSTNSQEGCAIMPKPFPAEFHRDVVAVARKREAPISQIAKDFGISEATLHAWLKTMALQGSQWV
jgi:hypothetical protein